MGFKGKGRVYTRIRSPFQSSPAHSNTRSHESFAKAWDLKLPLLRTWQHEWCDP
jgi:hypothetical protein